MIGQRIQYQNDFGTVKYCGPIVHENKGNTVWVGVEWDDPSRGRHNGTVCDHVYFKTNGNKNSGSLLRKEKVNFGVNILDAIFIKYFKRIPSDLHGILDEALIQTLQDTEHSTSLIHKAIREGKDQTDESEGVVHSYITIASQKSVMIETDRNIFFNSGKQQKKIVEFYGYDKIYEKINDLKNLRELSLAQLFVSTIGKQGFLHSIMPNLRILSLEDNFLFSWQQVFLIGSELKQLESLSLSGNYLQPVESYDYLLSLTQQLNKKENNEIVSEVPVVNQVVNNEIVSEVVNQVVNNEIVCDVAVDNQIENNEIVSEVPVVNQVVNNEIVSEVHQDNEESKNQIQTFQSSKELYILNYRVFCTESKQFKNISPLNIFKSLKTLILINMNLKWKQISQIFPAIQNIDELVLCKNNLTDYENLIIEPNELRYLTKLNLEDTNNSDFSLIQKAFGDLPNVENLNINHNQLNELCEIKGFKYVNQISLEFNLLQNCKFLSQLSILKNLKILSLKHNPVQDIIGKSYVRQRAIAEIESLEIMNGSKMTKWERKDAEIFYMRSAFEEYFMLKKVPHYYYDYEDFLKYAKVNHPRIEWLIKKFGNPYEIDPTCKGDITKPQRVANKAQHVQLYIVAKTGYRVVMDEPLMKKFMINTVLAKILGLQLKEIQFHVKIDEDSEPVLMDTTESTLEQYGVIDKSQVIVSSIK